MSLSDIWRARHSWVAEQAARLQEDVLGIEGVKTSEGGHGWARVVQDVLQSRCLRARRKGMDGRRPEQSGSKCVLHSHAE